MKTIFCMLILIACSGAVRSQSPNPTTASYQRALRVVERGFRVLGGEPGLAATAGISFDLEGDSFARNQSLLPFGEYDRSEIRTRVLFDLRAERLVWEQSGSFTGGLTFASRSVAARTGDGFNLNLERQSYAPLSSNPAIYGQATRIVTIYFLKRLLEQRAGLRYAGAAGYKGRSHHLVNALWNGQSFTLYFDVRTGFLTKNETVAPNPFGLDEAFEFVTDDYRSFGGIKLPTTYRQLRGGRLTRASTMTNVAVGDVSGRPEFGLPRDAVRQESVSFGVRRLTDQVYVVDGVNGGGYRVLFADIGDGIAVVDAPGSGAVSQQVIAEIGKVFPEKPVKYLILTHFHEDHAAGIREYVASGATIVTTIRNRAFFDAVVAAVPTIAPDRLARAPRSATFRFVEDEERFGELILKNVRSPHSADMYVVYIPGAKAIFQSDLFNYPDCAATRSTTDLVQKIAEFGWTVDRMISSHGGWIDYSLVRNEVSALDLVPEKVLP